MIPLIAFTKNHVVAACLMCAGQFSVIAAEPTTDGLLNQAQAAQLKGDRAEALSLAGKALAADPKNPQCYFVRGTIYAANGPHDKAVADFGEAIKLEPRGAALYQLRGLEHFKLGHMTESIADFDRYLEVVPNQAPHHWQRGIALYYAGRYEEGRKQFESHQTVNPNDVENAVWHYLCVARASGIEKARAAFIGIQEDRRVPMMQVHALFSGKGQPEEVLSAASAGSPTPARLDEQLFYAHLYLGLYYEAQGNDKLAREHIFKAADDYKADHYMGDVARVHAAILRRPKK
ncbi:MAG TPA: tetratricopeptide repeat protein [Verrucomicrobiae bacterium]